MAFQTDLQGRTAAQRGAGERPVTPSLGTSLALQKRAGDPHFVNVACSRAKSMLVLVGQISALAAKFPIWNAISKWLLKEKGHDSEGAPTIFQPKNLQEVRACAERLATGYSVSATTQTKKRSPGQSPSSVTSAGAPAKRRRDEK